MEALKSLNPTQQQAVTHPEGPALIMAGAGSGKTRVLTTRAAWILQTQPPILGQSTQPTTTRPENILLVTFTNKAAQEMNKRVESLAGVTLPWAGTFHRLGARLLRQEGHLLGLNPNFVIYDSDDQLSLLKHIYKDKNLSVKKFAPQAIKNAISTAKNELLSAEEYEQIAQSEFQEFVAQLYRWYQTALREHQAVDFDDLLGLTVELLQNHPDVLHKYQELFHHVLVDEYQDTNKAQYQITTLLARPHNQVFVVGDFAQSIYAWRGADYRNMLNLRQDFPNITEYRLEQNYRSTQTILDAATQIMQRTTAHPVLDLWTENTSGHPITVFETGSADHEAEAVLREITQLRSDYGYHQMVVLYRTNAQSRPFEEALVRAGISYRVVGGFKFYERKEVKDLLSYLRLLLNPADRVSQTRAEKLGKRRLAAFEQWRGQDHPTQPQQLLTEIIAATHFLDQFDEKDPQDLSRLENIQELVAVAGHFNEMALFLENIALVQDDTFSDAPTPTDPSQPTHSSQPTQSTQPTQAATEPLTLMSLHSAKGLEFPVVFMVGMEEGLLPHSRSLYDSSQMEEERRLCYVGITRAQDRLYFSFARQRWLNGSSSYSVRSRFLADIAEGLLDEKSSGYLAPTPHTTPNNNYSRWDNQARSTTRPTAALGSNSGRHLVIDDDTLEAVLNGEMDAASFFKN